MSDVKIEGTSNITSNNSDQIPTGATTGNTIETATPHTNNTSTTSTTSASSSQGTSAKVCPVMKQPAKPKAKRQRNRTPKSCIQCSQRKIYCSKERPACSNCIKYAVGHLCSYALPPWAEAANSSNKEGEAKVVGNNSNSSNGANSETAAPRASIGQTSQTSQTTPIAPVKIQQTEEYRQLKANTEKIISSQRKEIDDLKRQLSVVQQLSPREAITKQQSLHQIGQVSVTILNKISLLASTYLANKIEITNDYGINVITNSTLTPKSVYVDMYSWINLIKLDPQLTTLWYRITNLQKMYHVYKMNMLKSGQQRQQLQIQQLELQLELLTPLQQPNPVHPLHSPHPPQSHLHLLTSPSLLTPVMKEDSVFQKKQRLAGNTKKSNYKINEVDFTYSLQPLTSNLSDGVSPRGVGTPGSAASDDIHKCPVVECDFNFMSEEQPTLTPSPYKTTPKSDPSPQPIYKTETLDNNNKFYRIKKPINLHGKLLTLWESLLTLPRGDTKLDIQQIHFLLDYYYKSNFESKAILSFYRFDVQSVFKKSFNDEVVLNLPQGVEEDINYQLKSMGVYLCMLVLIIEETLNDLRLSVKYGTDKELCLQFEDVFPNEIPLLGLGVKQNHLLYMVQDFVSSYDTENKKSLSYCALILSLLSREIDDYKMPGSSISDTKSSFTSLFTDFLHVLLDGSLELWKDPELVELKSQYKKRKKDLKIHFCRLWVNIVRLSNLVTLNFVPLIKHSEYLDNLLKRIFQKIEQVDLLQYHLKYLSSKTNEGELIVTLHVHYLIASVSCTLCRGIMNLGSSRLTVYQLESLIEQCQTWKQDLGVDRLSNELRKFELEIILEYLRYFMTYILMLQGEENSDIAIMQNISPDILTRLMQLLQRLNKMSNTDDDDDNHHHHHHHHYPQYYRSQYVYSVMTEALTRLIHFVVGLMLRFQHNGSSPHQETTNLISQTCESVKTNDLGLITSTAFISKLSDEVDRAIGFLSKALLHQERVTKLSKLWKLYLMLIKNENYARLHAGLPEFSGNNSNANGMQAVCPVIGHGSGHSSGNGDESGGVIKTKLPSTRQLGSSLVESASRCPVVGHGAENSPLGASMQIPFSSQRGGVGSGVGSGAGINGEVKKEVSKCPISQITTPTNDDEVPSDPTKMSSFAGPSLSLQMKVDPYSPSGLNSSAHATTNGIAAGSAGGVGGGNSKKRKCPFDHSAMMRPNLYPNHIESSIRGTAGSTLLSSVSITNNSNFNEHKTYSPSPLSMSYTTPAAFPQQVTQHITPVQQKQQANLQQQQPHPQQQQQQHQHQQQQQQFVAAPTAHASTIDRNSFNNFVSGPGSVVGAPMTNIPSMDSGLDMLNQFNDFDFDFLNNENLFEHFGGLGGMDFSTGNGAVANASLNNGNLNATNMDDGTNFGNSSGNIEGFFQ
ncbi:hypothetical protein LELG_03818 [Lodderomyces elongisporus NRRL YB-4239]|uniref:Zn(2)-C6 fungal-type domain-containing protein n=1 Tax=Lodderomyces elongisporus (strain ATCC 11503 / CBS 2605 / JCM 1781 / NBRC 1676 / NRRL YB-4239) TaxID=379508 RepID=A5E2I1_LODEL|nr:hypothetical protein LELG_03818 [Lodderomyces elongisporus NRRL YB-4239]